MSWRSEQDFICQTQPATSTNLTLGRDWFRALDAAVLGAAGVDLQLWGVDADACGMHDTRQWL